MSEHLLMLHIKEEWRRLTSYFSSQTMFLLFPVVLLGVGFGCAVLFPRIESAFDGSRLSLALHLILFVYGILVGGFGFFADEVSFKWFGETHLLLHMPSILPVSFRRVFFWFYLKDILYYLSLTIAPLFLGAALAGAVPPPLLARLTLSCALSFALGVSVCFLFSSLYVRNKAFFVFSATVFFVWGRMMSLDDFPPLAFFSGGGIHHLLSSLALFVLLSFCSLALAEPRESRPSRRFVKSALFSRIEPLSAKETVDIVRSGTHTIILTSYLFPLLFLYGMIAFSGRLLRFDLDLSLAFYAVFLGYLGTLVYSWLHNIDPPSSFATLPVSVPDLIRRKIKIFLVASLPLSFLYLLALSFVMGEPALLPLSFLLMGTTTFYVACVTAHLCGLHPNVMLFSGSVLARYMGMILPLLICLSLLSFMKADAILLALCAPMLVLSLFLYRDLDRKYAEAFL